MSSWNPSKGRVIFHVDMNCFYASVETVLDPSLRGKPLAIAGNPEERRGIIVTSSYEARAKGVKTTMPIWEAKKLCPELIIRRPDFEQYRAASKKMFSILAKITNFVEPVSIDEGYIDITNNGTNDHPISVAEKIQQMLLTQLGLPCSIGIGPNKFLAKTASDMKKPLGITVLRIRDMPTMLWPLPVEQMYGVGAKTAAKLQSIQIHTIGQLAKRDVYDLTQLLGINGERLNSRANGIDLRPVDPDAIHTFKSISSSQTLPNDTTNTNEINQLLQQLSINVDQRMKRKNVVGLSVQLMIRYDNRDTITRSKKLVTYIGDKTDIYNIAFGLFQKHWNQEPVRLLGITVQHIKERINTGKQLDLFTFEKEIRNDKLQTAINKLTDKYGTQTFKKLDDHKEDVTFTTSFQKDFLDDFKK